MDRFINWIAGVVRRLFRLLFTTSEGWIFVGVMIFVLMIKFQPDMLADFFSKLCAWLINLAARIIEANRKSIELLFCIGMMCYFGIYLPIRAFSRKGGRKP